MGVDSQCHYREFPFLVAKHSKNFRLKEQVERWQSTQPADASTKLLIYQAFIEDETGFPKHLARRVHDLYQPISEEFQPRSMWSLSNAVY